MTGGIDDDDPPVSERHERARKVKRQLAQGELVKVAWARNQAEGELIQSLLLEHGVPSMLRRTAGFDVPDFLAAGPRDVMVAQSGLETAREVLLEQPDFGDAVAGGARPGGPPRAPGVSPGVLAAGIAIALLLLLLLTWLAT